MLLTTSLSSRRRRVAPPSGGGGGGSSNLAIAASLMSAGTWQRFDDQSGPGWTGCSKSQLDSILNATVSPADPSNINPYAANGHYIPQSDKILFVGAAHGSATGMGVFEFSLANNTWACVSGIAGTPSSYPMFPGIDSLAGPGHEFNLTSVNPNTGDAYICIYGGGDKTPVGGGPAYKIETRRKPLAGNTFSVNLPKNMPDQAFNITAGCCWWSGAFTAPAADGTNVLAGGASAGAQGMWLLFNGYINGTLNGYDPVANSWFFCRTNAFLGQGGSGQYHHQAAYSAVKNCAVYGGGNAAPTTLFKLSSDGSITQMPALPSGGVGVTQGRLSADPVTGNFIVLSATGPGAQVMYELNPDGAGSWTQLTGSRLPPGNPFAQPGYCINVDPGCGVFVVPMPTLGVTVYVRGTLVNDGQMWVYKHA